MSSEISTTGREYNLQPELKHIVDMVKPGSRVLDLGCGEGDLLKALQIQKRARVQGIELSDTAIQECITKGLFVYHGDLDEGLADFNDQSMDYVILTNTIQVLHRPDFLIQEAARVGRHCIISIPNFGYWRVRFQLLLKGTMPRTSRLPYDWYDSPNIHLTTIADFRRFCREHDLAIVHETNLVIGENKCDPVRFAPNILSDYGIFLLKQK
ncbi:methionine biosynthesis protein MetW [bacterium]|nr:methionine biosynthesis protein MetW [bacterium]